MVLAEITGFLEAVATTLVSTYGLLGLFVASIIGNATIFFPAPIALIVFGLGVLAAQQGLGIPFVLMVGVTAGAGAAIGELSGYFVGFLGRRGVKRFYSSINPFALSEIEHRLKQHGVLVVFLGALSPLPFDIFGLAAGMIQFDVKQFFVATLAGKIIRDCVIALAGFYGMELIGTIFA